MSEELDNLSTEEVEAKSMDDTIRETLEAIESRGAEDVPEEVVEEAPEGRQRDDRGRFAAKQEEPAPEAVQETVQEDTKPSVPPELQKLGLRKDEAEAIASNPVAMQAFMRRSEEMHKGLEQYRAKAQFGHQMEQVVSPYMATMQAMGISPDVAVSKLLSADQTLRFGSAQQKQQMIANIARDYGIDISQGIQQAEQPYIDPRVNDLQSELNRMRSYIEQQNQAREWQERETLNSEISKFSSDPAHTHFEAVRSEMAALLQAGLATDLKDAYEKAIYANPTIRNQVLAEQQAKAEEARRAEATKKAQAAKQAASVNVARRGIAPPARPVGSMDDTIRQAAERLGIL